MYTARWGGDGDDRSWIAREIWPPHSAMRLWSRRLERRSTRARTTKAGACAISAHTGPRVGVDDGTRTRDSQNHNLVLYQLNYAHHRFRVSGTRDLL